MSNDLRTLSASLVAALKWHTDAQRDAAHHEDEDLSLPALDRRRAELSADARAQLSSFVANARIGYEAARRANARDLDRVPAATASTRDAWERVTMLLDSGRTLAEVVATADRETLLAVNEWGPTYLEAQAPAPRLGEAREPVDLAPLERSVRARWAELTGDRILKKALADAPALATAEVQLRNAEAVAAGNDHAGGLIGAVEAELAGKAAEADLAAYALTIEAEKGESR
ncbi:hypothetical protein ACWEBH_12945 [Micrococcus endophyticus]